MGDPKKSGYQKKKPDPPSDAGRPPSHDHEGEQVVLATIILVPEALFAIHSTLKVEHFFEERHRLIYEAALAVLARREPVDLNTIRAQLHATNKLEQAGGVVYLGELTRLESTDKIDVIRAYVKRVLDAAAKRDFQEWTAIARAESFDAPDMDTFKVEKARDLAVRAHQSRSGQLVHVARTVEVSVSGAQQRGKGNHLSRVTPTGMVSVDNATAGGVHDEDLWIVAARPGAGKTSIALGIARSVGTPVDERTWPIHLPKLGVVVFSLEMPRVQNVDRLICMEGDVPLEKWRTGQLNDAAWFNANRAAHRISESYIWIDDSPNSMFDIEAKVRALKAEFDKPAIFAGCPICPMQLEHSHHHDKWYCPACHPNPFSADARLYDTRKQLTREERISLVIIDHLGKVKGREDAFSRATQVGESSGYAKEMARADRLNCGVMLLVQLNRELEKRQGKDKRPQLSDLKESGNIEEDADVVIFPNRPKYQSGEGSDEDAELHIAKQRNGKTYVGKEAIRVRYVPACSRFDDLENYTTNDTSPGYTGDFPPGL